jgi:ribosomal protein L37AE/L43A
MQVFLNSYSQWLIEPKIGKSQEEIAQTQFSLISRHTCPCCLYILLRHLGLGGLYWRCSHCYQEMPAFYQVTYLLFK